MQLSQTSRCCPLLLSISLLGGVVSGQIVQPGATTVVTDDFDTDCLGDPYCGAPPFPPGCFPVDVNAEGNAGGSNWNGCQWIGGSEVFVDEFPALDDGPQRPGRVPETSGQFMRGRRRDTVPRLSPTRGWWARHSAGLGGTALALLGSLKAEDERWDPEGPERQATASWKPKPEVCRLALQTCRPGQPLPGLPQELLDHTLDVLIPRMSREDVL